MKRSRTVRLAFLGSASALALVACDEAKDPLAEANFFRDPVECAQKLDRAACEASFAEARTEHLRSAPAFASREACEQAYGAANCAWQETNVSPEQVQEQKPGTTTPTASSSGGWFMPMMMGYMLGNALGNRSMMPGQAMPPGQAAASAAPGGNAMGARPIYRNASNQVFSGRSALGTSRVAAASTTSRGGFGTTSRSYGSSSSS
jgi:uncharacterized protein YgiB involved in biofilm formation